MKIHRSQQKQAYSYRIWVHVCWIEMKPTPSCFPCYSRAVISKNTNSLEWGREGLKCLWCADLLLEADGSPFLEKWRKHFLTSKGHPNATQKRNQTNDQAKSFSELAFKAVSIKCKNFRLLFLSKCHIYSCHLSRTIPVASGAGWVGEISSDPVTVSWEARWI